MPVLDLKPPSPSTPFPFHPTFRKPIGTNTLLICNLAVWGLSARLGLPYSAFFPGLVNTNSILQGAQSLSYVAPQSIVEERDVGVRFGWDPCRVATSQRPQWWQRPGLLKPVRELLN